MDYEEEPEAPTEAAAKSNNEMEAADSDTNRGGRCSQWMSNHRLGWVVHLPGKWPRTFSLVFGVVGLDMHSYLVGIKEYPSSRQHFTHSAPHHHLSTLDHTTLCLNCCFHVLWLWPGQTRSPGRDRGQ